MKTSHLFRTRWAAIGAAVAVTLGAGGLYTVRAASAPSSMVAITPVRVLDTRVDLGLVGPLTSDAQSKLDVTDTAQSPVPAGATAIVANVTVVSPTTLGFVSVRPGDATGLPATSNLNFLAGGVVPNSVTVELPTAGAAAGTIDLVFHGTDATATAHLLIDIVGYYQAGGPGTQGPTGPQGATGPQGDTGASGLRGLSAWDTIPSGQTVIGELIFDTHQSETLDFDAIYTAFPGRAPAPVNDVNFAPHQAASDDDPTCTGTGPAPTAPAGKVCLYIITVSPENQVAGGSGILADRGFRVAVTPTELLNAGGEQFIYATWAYTAP